MAELANKRVLVVEDNAILAFNLVDLLEERGAEVVGPALDLDTGLKLAAGNDLDAALLDIELGDVRVWPLAEELHAHSTPFAFISAQCTQEDLPAPFATRVCLEKPAGEEDIVATVSQLLAAES